MKNISKNKKASVFYHNLFDYPLRKEELTKWEVGGFALSLFPKRIRVSTKEGLYFISGREDIVSLRKRRNIYSQKKVELARRTALFLSFLPTLKMIGLTGSLAMLNADRDSDIDLMFITKSGFLWTTRFLVYLLLLVSGIPFRRFGDVITKDKLCLNIWMEESDLTWHRKNIFTAHEIVQIVPIVNKDKTYEKFLFNNLWVFDFWPNAINKRKLDLKSLGNKRVSGIVCRFWSPVELFFFLVQRLYMLGKSKREVISLRRAIFHPIDLSHTIIKKIKTP